MEVTALARILLPLLAAVDGLTDLTTKKQRDFLAGWGATMQDKGAWGEDMGNVVYAAAWGLIVALCNGGRRCCNITGFGSSAQMIETLMGIMYWARAGVGTLGEFRRECEMRKMGHLSVWEPTYSFLRKEARGADTLLEWYPILNEYLCLWGGPVLRENGGEALGALEAC